LKKKSVIFAAITIVLILAANLPLAWGYFSTYTEARGGVRIQPKKIETEIEEPDISDWTKHVVITNSEDGTSVYIRAKAFCGSEYNLTYEGDHWKPGADGFYYYDGILEPGMETPELLVKINNHPEEEDGQEFNVVVIYESTPVRYDENGNPYANWSQTLRARERGAE
jgi:hypothetical protein